MEKVQPLPLTQIISSRGYSEIETFELAAPCPRCDSPTGHVLTAQAKYATGFEYACHGCLLLRLPDWVPTRK